MNCFETGFFYEVYLPRATRASNCKFKLLVQGGGCIFYTIFRRCLYGGGGNLIMVVVRALSAAAQ